MDRYQRVEKPKEETPINENEIRVTAQGRMLNYITYATSLLQEKEATEIALKAMGRAINKTVMITELIKRRVARLHQNTSISSTDITDTWEPLEEGLLPLETTRHVSVITITLSKNELDTSSTGYQPPIPQDQVKIGHVQDHQGGGHQSTMGRIRGGRGRGRDRGRGNYINGGAEHVLDGAADGGQGFSSRGRGWGRGYRGRGRGGYMGQGQRYTYVGGNINRYPSTLNNSNGGGPLGPSQGRGRGRGWGMVRGQGRGRGRGFRSNANGPSQPAAA
ncbi:protein no-on-transient A-like [Punica granatum]|uniref:Protein no-on-transient A-like n=2 Tax=Punica granatum TaxID=22663 RepID=A0A6P8C3W0_PUNGR|nr:protein no-on-transient A-like [Punica granatum]